MHRIFSAKTVSQKALQFADALNYGLNDDEIAWWNNLLSFTISRYKDEQWNEIATSLIMHIVKYSTHQQNNTNLLQGMFSNLSTIIALNLLSPFVPSTVRMKGVKVLLNILKNNSLIDQKNRNTFSIKIKVSMKNYKLIS